MLFNTPSFAVSNVSTASFMNTWQNKYAKGRTSQKRSGGIFRTDFHKVPHSESFKKCLQFLVTFGFLNHLVAQFVVERKLGTGFLPFLRHFCQGHICLYRGYRDPCAHAKHAGILVSLPWWFAQDEVFRAALLCPKAVSSIYFHVVWLW